MSDWQHCLPHTVEAPPHRGQNLDYGQTVPLTHAPMLVHQVGDQFNSTHHGYLSVNNQCYNNTTIPRTSFLASDLNKIKSQRQRKRNTPEKKRLQTADYRWMFTKRKGISC